MTIRAQPSPRNASIWLAIVLSLGVLTFLPAMRSPLMFDDYLHVAMIEGTYPAKRSPFDLYNFVSDSDRNVLRERGVIPWWSSPQLTIRFFRPLSSVLMWADHKAFSNSAALLHLHSLAWWALGVVAVRRLLGRVLSVRATLLAVTVFALGQWHATPLAWVANREALVSLALGAFAFDAYVQWRGNRSVTVAILSTMLFALALLSGEYALSFGGYVVAWELTRSREALPRRLLGLAPFVATSVTYLVIRSRLDYGTRGTSFYSDPLHAPLVFLQTMPSRMLTLFVDGWFSVDAHTWPETQSRWAFLGAIGGLVFVFPVAWRVISSLDDSVRRDAIALLAGSVLALLPVLAVSPTPRLLGVNSIGMSAIVALVVDHAWFRSEAKVADLTGLVATGLAFVHFIYGPTSAWLTCEQLRKTSSAFAIEAARLGKTVDDFANADLVVIRGLGGMFFGPFSLDRKATPVAHWAILAQTGHVLVLRKDPRTIEVILPTGRTLYPTGDANLFRSDAEPMKPNDTLTAQGIRATVVKIGDGGAPSDVLFAFDRNLDDRALRFLSERFDGFRDVTLPEPGFGMPLEPWSAGP